MRRFRGGYILHAVVHTDTFTYKNDIMDTPPSSPSNTGGMFQGASPKLTFAFGVVTGALVTAIIGAAILIPAWVKKSPSSATTTDTNTGTTTYGNVKPVSSDDYVRGDKDAELTLIEYSDLECPFCKRFHPVMLQVMDEYKGKVRWVYRQFPLTEIHQNAQKESVAALCVGKLGGSDAYWKFTDAIFDRSAAGGTGFNLTDLPALAKEVGVNESKFNDCYNGTEMDARVTAETADGAGAGAQGTPTTFVVDKSGKTLTTFPGYVTFDQVKATLDSILNS